MKLTMEHGWYFPAVLVSLVHHKLDADKIEYYSYTGAHPPFIRMGVSASFQLRRDGNKPNSSKADGVPWNAFSFLLGAGLWDWKPKRVKLSGPVEVSLRFANWRRTESKKDSSCAEPICKQPILCLLLFYYFMIFLVSAPWEKKEKRADSLAPVTESITAVMSPTAVYWTLTESRCTGYSPSCAAPRITALIASTAYSIASPPTPLTD